MLTVFHYKSPIWADKKTIWPPISKEIAFEGVQKGVDGGAEHSGKDTATTHIQSTLPQRPSKNVLRLTADKDVLYHPLHSGETIRILELHPGQTNDPITCDFHYADLQHPHIGYEALSYVWGQKSDLTYNENECEETIHTIQCNGYQRETTANLHQALRYIRKPSEPAFLWVDALCINQDDNLERGHQVALMGSIYKNAGRVLIWIGEHRIRGIYNDVEERNIDPPSELEGVRAQRSFGAICDIVNRWKGSESEPAASYIVADPAQSGKVTKFSTFEEHPSTERANIDRDFMRRIVAPRLTHPRFRKLEPRIWATSNQEGNPIVDLGIDSTIETAPYSHLWLSIADLFGRSWFWRVWIVQECVLARAAVVKCANAEIDWRWVGLAAAIIRTNYHGICEKMHIGGAYNAYLMFRMSPMSDLPPPTLSFIDLLRLTRQFEVTDSRDRVYGLLGIKTIDNDPTTNSLFVRPDYSLSANELWKQLAWQAIQHSGSLSILSSVQYTTENYDSESIIGGMRHLWETTNVKVTSSWVPEWERVYRATLSPWDTREAFAAAREFPLTLFDQSDTAPDILRVEGIYVGTIGVGGAYMWHDIDTALPCSKHLASFFMTESGLRLLSRVYTAGRNAYGSLTEPTDEAFFDFAAYLLKHKSKQKYEQQNYRNSPDILDAHPSLKSMLEVWANKGDATRFLQASLTYCERRRLFITFNGFVGLGPDSVRGGDIITVLAGGDVPFLLRPISGTETYTGNNCTSLVDRDAKEQQYLLVGECYVEGLMQGEAVRATKAISELSGPVPHELVLQEIVAYGNEVDAITMEALEKRACVIPEKSIFNIR